MEVSRGGEPGHDRRVFHRVPSPISTPPQDLIRPAAAEHIAHGQKEPRQESPAARSADPYLPKLSSGQGSHSKSKRHRSADIAQVQRGGMDGHPIIL